LKKAYLFLIGFLFLFTLSSPAVSADQHGVRGHFLDFISDPFFTDNDLDSARYTKDGLLVIEDGLIKDFGAYETLIKKYPGLKVEHYQDKIIMPGFIDCHAHYPQTKIIAAFGKELLGWLKKWVWPEEEKFTDKEYASKVANIFFDFLLKNGTTTAQVFTTTSPQSVESFF